MKRTFLSLGVITATLLGMTSCGMFSGTNTAATATAADASAAATTAATTAANAVSTAATTTTTTIANSAAASYGQGAGTALINLYKQYKADGKFDASNTNNIINSLQLMANCTMLKDNVKDKSFLADYSQGLLLGASGLVTTANVDNVMSGLTSLATTASSTAANSVNNAVSQATTTANNALGQASSSISSALNQASTVAQSASSISSLLSLFSQQ